jgi:DNA-binding transcriptional ArsR family regulator
MSNNEFRDVISYDQCLFKVLRDEKTLKAFANKNLAYLLKFLRDHQRPMTAKELEEAFKKEAQISGKSDKTIYRYLGQLEKAGLVVQAGMRMYPDKTKSQTLYGLPAKLFLPDYSVAESVISPKTKDEVSRITKGVEALIRNYFGYEKTPKSEAGIDELVQKFTRDFYDRKIQLVEKSEDELSEIIRDLDPRQVDIIFSKACSFVLLSENGNWNKALKDCFQD